MPSLLDAARLSRADAVLAALAVAGLVALVALLPRVQPDTAASFALTEAGAVARADAYLAEAGYDASSYRSVATYSGSGALMDSLQRTLGRPAVTAALRAEPGALPAFRWRIQYDRVRDRGEVAFPQPPFTVDLGTDGRLWRLENGQHARPASTPDRSGVARRLQPSDAAPAPLPETIRYDPLSFAVDSAGVDLGAGWAGGLVADRAVLAQEGPRTLGPSAAAALAQRALVGTAYEGLGMVPVRVVPKEGGRAAEVRLEAPERVWQQQVAVGVEVSAMGEVLGIEPQINEPAEEPEAAPPPLPPNEPGRARASLSWDSDLPWTSVVAFGAWVLLGLVYVVAFVRRLAIRALDLRAALVDAAAVALAVSVFPVLMFELTKRSYPFTGVQLFLALAFGTLLWMAGAGVMAMVASGVSDSLMRARRREKLDALALLRQGRVLNGLVGASLVRGALASVALMGLLAVLWTVLPLKAAYEGDGWAAFQYALSPALFMVTQAFWLQVVIGLALFAGGGAVLMGAFRSRIPEEGPLRAALVVGGLGIGAAVLGLGPGWITSEPEGAVWAYAGVYGAALGLVLWRYDVLATLAAYVLAEAAWNMAPALWAEAAPFAPDAAAVLALIPLVGAVGAVGLRRAPAASDLRRYVPAYITELAERERLQREVEIAREVQRSFLPATMPDVPGLDLAAVCLPAEEVGGDYYDAFPVAGPDGGPPRLAVVVGDVSGKGIQAAFYMTLVKGVLRTLAPSGLGPAAVLARLNEVFAENARPGAFVSLIYGVIDPEARTFTYARAGHNPLLVRRHGPTAPVDVEARRPGGLGVGLTAGGAFAQTLREDTVHLRPGDALVLYTDGLSEAMDEERRLYTDARLARLFAAAEDGAAAALVGHAIADVRAFASADANPDDMTLLVARLTA